MKIRELKLGLVLLGMCVLIGAGSVSVQASSLDAGSVSGCDIVDELENVTAFSSYKPYEDASYELLYKNDSSGVYIMGYQGTAEGKLVLPESIGGVDVVGIGYSAFSRCTGFTGDLIIPSKVTRILDNAFDGCTGFDGCLQLPEGLNEIGLRAFADCSGLTGDLVIPESVSIMENKVFMGDKGFNGKVQIPSSWESIPDYTFYNCSKLCGELNLPDGLKSIGKSAFMGCYKLSGTLELPETLTEIGEGAFYACAGFTGDLVIPEGVTTIEKTTFANWNGTHGRICLPDTLTTIDEAAFVYSTGFCGTLQLPEGLTTIGEYAFSGCTGLTGDLVIPDSVTKIDMCAFMDCDGFDGRLQLPSNLQVINTGVFFRCFNLSGKLVLPETITEIGEGAFGYCYSLEGDLVISEQVEKIGNNAFKYCNGFNRNVCIFTDTTDIGEAAFLLPYSVNNMPCEEACYQMVTIHAPKGYYAESYAKEYGHNYKEWVYSLDVTYQGPFLLGQTYSPTIVGADASSVTWSSSNDHIVAVDAQGVITVKNGGTVTITAEAYSGVKEEVEITVGLPEGGYIGHINSELISFDLKQTAEGNSYLTGQIVVVEWVDGVSTVPTEAPVMTFKSTDGTEAIEVFVTPTGTNTYYFDRFISGFTEGKEYVFEISSGDDKNYSPYRSMNVSIATSPNMPEIKHLGMVGEQRIAYYQANGNGEMRLYNKTYEYEGIFNTELLNVELVKGPNGNYISGEIVAVEWVDGVSTVPFMTPRMIFADVELQGVLDVFVTPTGTNTYYFDRSLGDLDPSKEYIFIMGSADPLNVSDDDYLVVTTAGMSVKEGLLWETDTQYVRYRTDANTGQLRVYAVNK